MKFITIINQIKLHITKKKFSNIKIGENVHIDFNTKIRIGDNLFEIEDGVTIRSIAKGYHAAMAFPSTFFIDVENAYIKIGKNSRLNGVYVHAQKGISIGKNCVIASGVIIIDSNGHIINSKNRTKGRDKPKEIVIKDNVWIGLNCIILKGTLIGDNSIVSAGSVVQGIFPPNSLIKGNPAQVTDVILLK